MDLEERNYSEELKFVKIKSCTLNSFLLSIKKTAKAWKPAGEGKTVRGGGGTSEV